MLVDISFYTECGRSLTRVAYMNDSFQILYRSDNMCAFAESVCMLFAFIENVIFQVYVFSLLRSRFRSKFHH